jgi:hypothetical protein
MQKSKDTQKKLTEAQIMFVRRKQVDSIIPTISLKFLNRQSWTKTILVFECLDVRVHGFHVRGAICAQKVIELWRLNMCGIHICL